jgi:hypothetical protein
MRKSLAILMCCAVFLVGVMAFVTSADARRGGVRMGGGHASVGRAYRGNVSINRSTTRNVNRTVNRQYVYRNGRRGYWRNGVWVVAPAVAGGTYGYRAACSYEYRRWQSTGSSYWRNRYYQCVN